MILISHRGNIDGPKPELENTPNYIDKAIKLGYMVEIDLWYVNYKLYLGHDSPEYEVNLGWLYIRMDKLWIHCKNINAINFIQRSDFRFFWHEEDTITLTSKRDIWAYPGKQPIENSIAVMPEIHDDDISQVKGICSDYIKKYK